MFVKSPDVCNYFMICISENKCYWRSVKMPKKIPGAKQPCIWFSTQEPDMINRAHLHITTTLSWGMRGGAKAHISVKHTKLPPFAIKCKCQILNGDFTYQGHLLCPISQENEVLCLLFSQTELTRNILPNVVFSCALPTAYSILEV